MGAQSTVALELLPTLAKCDATCLVVTVPSLLYLPTLLVFPGVSPQIKALHVSFLENTSSLAEQMGGGVPLITVENFGGTSGAKSKGGIALKSEHLLTHGHHPSFPSAGPNLPVPTTLCRGAFAVSAVLAESHQDPAKHRQQQNPL